jgi:transposase-like protein
VKHYATKKSGRYRCGEKECRRDFTVMTGTAMERSRENSKYCYQNWI